MKNPLESIRLNQKKLRKLTNDGWCALYAEKGKTEKRSISTLWAWERDPDHPEHREMDVRYLKFLCKEFNYNPAFVLGMVDKPDFILDVGDLENKFPETECVLMALAKYPSLGVIFRKMVTESDFENVKKSHLEFFERNPKIYVEIKTIVDAFIKHPELQNGS